MDRSLKTLETLHECLAKELLGKIKSGEAKAGDLNVARQFLKDNGIECIPVESNPMQQLMENLPDLDAVPLAEI
jgi:Zn-dependent membrane protease YugP